MRTPAMFVFLALFAGLLSALAQEQSGSVAIAEHIRPAVDTTLTDFTACVEKLKNVGVETKEAVASCKDVTKIASKTTTRIANEAADATKASRPIMLYNRYGYGGYGSYGYGSYGYQRPVAVRQPPPVREPAPPRQPPPVRPAPPPRTAPVR